MRFEEVANNGPAKQIRPTEMQKATFGENIKVSRIGPWTLVHTDDPTEEVMAERVQSFDPEQYLDDRCPLCLAIREGGGTIVHPEDFNS